MSSARLAPRLARLPRADACGLDLPVASGPVSRLLGLAHLDRERAGTGLLIPGCRCVHTFGMRFPLRLVFLDGEGRPLRVVERLGPRRIAACRGASAVLELPAAPDARPFRPPAPEPPASQPAGGGENRRPRTP